MDKVTIKIPRPLYEKIQRIIPGSSFSSPTDFIVYVLRDVMGAGPAAGRPAGEASVDDLTAEEVAAIKKRLRSLGYL